MSTPKVETIAVKLKALVDAVTEANGFNQDLTAVRPKRIHLESDINDDNTVIIQQEDASIIDQTYDTIKWRQGFTLQALVIDSDDATTPIDTRLNKVAFDIIKKIYTGNNWKLDGYADAIYLQEKAIEPFLPPQARCSGVAVNIYVDYEQTIADLTA